MNNYVVTAHKASAVLHTAVGNFFSPTERNLLVGRNTRIDVYDLDREGLIHRMEIPIYGRIAVMKLCRPQSEKQDQLFLLTERYNFCVLKWNTVTGECDTVAGGDVTDMIGRHNENCLLGIVDPQFRYFGLHLYERLFKIIPTAYSKEAYNIQIKQGVRDIQFLHGCKRPTIVCLYGEKEEHRVVQALEIPKDANEAVDPPIKLWKEELQNNVANILIAVPEPLCGVLVVSDDCIIYLPGVPDQQKKTRPIKPATTIKAVGSSQLSESTPISILRNLMSEGGVVSGLKMETLGITSIASAISYLDNGYVFIGSKYGDSQLIKLLREVDPETNMNLKIMATYPNLGPILDFCVVDLDRQGQDQLVTCSGGQKDGSLRVIRNGISINEQASVELSGVKEMFSLKRNVNDQFHSFLVQSFTTETRILEMVSAEEMQEASIRGFDESSPTIYAGNMKGNFLVQITASSVLLLDADTKIVVNEWNPPSGSRISLGSGNTEQLLVATSGGSLVSFEVDTEANRIVEMSHCSFENELSCLDCSPLGDETRAQFAAVGTWKDVTVRLVSLPDLKVIVTEHLGGDTIARSLLLVTLEGINTLLVAAGEGEIFSYRLNSGSSTGDILFDKRKVGVGTQPATLTAFRNRNSTAVFAACDRPTVIHAATSTQKLLCSNVNLREVTRVCCFDSEAFPDCLAISTEDTLIIGGVDDVQKLHIRTIPLGEQPRRIARQESTRTFGVICEKEPEPDESAYDPNRTMCSVRFFDDEFRVVATFNLEQLELGLSILSTSFNNTDMDTGDEKEYFVVGTAYNDPVDEENECKQGRLVVLELDEANNLNVVAQQRVRGAVHCMKPFQGALIAGINGRVLLLRWSESEETGSRWNLVPECSHRGYSLVMMLDTRSNLIVSADMVKSVTLIAYKAADKCLVNVVRDYDAKYMTAVAMIDDDNYLGIDQSFNMFTLRRNAYRLGDDTRLENVGEFHLGESVINIRRGSLFMHNSNSEGPVISSHIFGTQDGMIGTVSQLEPEEWKFLHGVQQAMTEVVKGIGGLKHSDWRSFHDHRRTNDWKQFLDGDLIERFLDLKKDKMEKVAQAVDVSVEELTKRIEELSRLH